MKTGNSPAGAKSMLSKMFKKNESSAPLTAAPPALSAADAQAADKLAWENQLQAAMGDDAALLALAQAAPLIDIKHAAVQALSSEDALKRAEREFRERDRRVHRAAKQRYEALVDQRTARHSANKLLEAAAVLLYDASIPANRLVELERAWQALDGKLLEDAQHAAFAARWASLTALARERGEQQQMLTRWLADAQQALAQVNTLCAQVMEGVEQRAELSVARDAADALLAATPPAPGAEDKQNKLHLSLLHDLQQASHVASAIEARLKLLDELDAGTTAPLETPASDPSVAARWRALPPCADTRIADSLNARFAQWQREQSDARHGHLAQAKQRAKAESQAAKQARVDALSGVLNDLLNTAEAALGAGQLGETAKQLAAIDAALKADKAPGVERKLHARIEALQAEVARLKGWQHWGGGLARDDLVREAEALAAVIANANPGEKAAAKFSIKAHADAIEHLRERWKELDKLGGATSRASWQRFDGALKTAYMPVAAHLDKLQAARKENLAARNRLIDELDAVKFADAPESGDGASETPDWRALARALEHFHTEWRKLGPLEHTVPRKAQNALVERMKASLARLEAPLQEARRVEQLQREKLLARAKALSADAQSRDVIAKVRDLQAEWQKHAKALPLARNVENALWAEFKAATDAVFKQRDAANAARTAEWHANQAVREALIARLGALYSGVDGGATSAEIKRTVAEVDAEWRKAGEAPKGVAAKLDAEFRAAREAAQQHLAGSALRTWHATCDALSAKLALCVELESAAPVDDIAARWAAQPALPAAWEQALQARFNARLNMTQSASDIPDGAAEAAFDAALLQLEAALDIASPPAFQAARRELKLRAMKNAVEARQATQISDTDITRWIAQAIAPPNTEETSQPVKLQRLAAALAALRNRPLK